MLTGLAKSGKGTMGWCYGFQTAPLYATTLEKS
ncbi:hypothetical protein [Xylanibacter rarus]